jgi:hypothetical protein
MMRWSELHGDMQRPAPRATGPPPSTSGGPSQVSAQEGAWLVTDLSEIPCRVSSDLHEWRNDLGAVSTRGSVKLQSR